MWRALVQERLGFKQPEVNFTRNTYVLAVVELGSGCCTCADVLILIIWYLFTRTQILYRLLAYWNSSTVEEQLFVPITRLLEFEYRRRTVVSTVRSLRDGNSCPSEVCLVL